MGWRGVGVGDRWGLESVGEEVGLGLKVGETWERRWRGLGLGERVGARDWWGLEALERAGAEVGEGAGLEIGGGWGNVGEEVWKRAWVTAEGWWGLGEVLERVGVGGKG